MRAGHDGLLLGDSNLPTGLDPSRILSTLPAIVRRFGIGRIDEAIASLSTYHKAGDSSASQEKPASVIIRIAGICQSDEAMDSDSTDGANAAEYGEGEHQTAHDKFQALPVTVRTRNVMSEPRSIDIFLPRLGIVAASSRAADDDALFQSSSFSNMTNRPRDTARITIDRMMTTGLAGSVGMTGTEGSPC